MEWLHFILRWVHLIAGISWIGHSFYFMWLDNALERPEPPDEEVEGKLWMVHSGGFYQVERRKIFPGKMPKILHWFKWEATFTWLSGFFLLGLVYYMSDGLYLLDPAVSDISSGAAIALSLGTLAISWLAYDWLMQSPLGQKKTLINVFLSLVFVGLSYWLTRVYSGRAAFIHIGAIFGTLMVLNVWVRILPGQQRMIDATNRGETPNYTDSKIAKARSTHNSYMTLPVLFMMLSNHFPNFYGHPQNWLVLVLLTLFGAGVRHIMLREKVLAWYSLIPLLSLVGLISITSPAYLKSLKETSVAVQGQTVSFLQVQAIVNLRCLPCHSQNPKDDRFGKSPGGVSFDQPENIKTFAERIHIRAVVSKTMPLANITSITEEERNTLDAWLTDWMKK